MTSKLILCLRVEYSQWKFHIIDEIGADTVEWYCLEKNKIVTKILKRAGWSDADLKIVTKQAPWVSI
jgi:hypothetical protein